MEPEDLERALAHAVAGLPDSTPEQASVAAAGSARRRRRAVAASSAFVVLVGAGLTVTNLDRDTPERLATASTSPGPSSPYESPYQSPSGPPSGSPSVSPTASPSASATSAGPSTQPPVPVVHPPSGPPSSSPAATCLPKLEPYQEPPAGPSASYPDRLLYAAPEGLSLVPTVDQQEPPPWSSELLIANESKGQTVRSVARTASGRIFVTVWMPCGVGVFTFGNDRRVTKVFDVAIEPSEEEWGDLLLSPDGRTLAVHSGWSYGPGWHTGHDVPPVVLIDVATGAVVRTVAVPEIITEWLADGSGFFYPESDGTLHRIRLDGSEGPVTAAPTGCAWTTVGRGRSGQLFGAHHCSAGNTAIVFAMDEDGTPGTELDRFSASNAVTELVPAPTGMAAVAVVAPASPYLVAQNEPAKRLNGCMGRSDCDAVAQDRAYGIAW